MHAPSEQHGFEARRKASPAEKLAKPAHVSNLQRCSVETLWGAYTLACMTVNAAHTLRYSHSQ
eukprot:scaffold61789_cov21-Tisochrysis_lutea.AAC.3